MIISFVISVVMIGLDQLTKFLIYGSAARSILGDFLWFESALNTGVAFSMFEGKSVVFIVTSLIASCVMVWLIISKKFFTSKFEKISIALVLGGTISNVIDRIVFGGVRDFIYLKFMNFAIFNVADMCVTIGAILLCLAIVISIFKSDKKEQISQNKEELKD